MQFDPLWLAVALSGLTAALAGVAAFRPRTAYDPLLADAVGDLGRDLAGLRTALAEDLRRGREETGSQARDLREELGSVVVRLGETLGGNIARLGAGQAEKLEGVVGNVTSLADANERRLVEMRRDGEESSKALREEVMRQLKTLGEVLDGNLEKGGTVQKEKLDGVATEIRRLVQTNAEANEALRRTVEGRLDTLRTDNAAKLEEMRKTVDEKLQGTLEERLGEKFKTVSEHLERVHRSVGEMQALAAGVGDLKKVLGNVKTRGTWAEVSLGSLLEQILTPEQFDRNVETVKGSNERVEFAIRLPGQEDGASVWLPVDAKFPSEDYERLIDASEAGDPGAVEAALKGLEARIKLEGAKICKKYVSPPETTDFAILYLPTEGLYAEVLRRPGLVDHLQGQCRIMVAGPTNLHAFLNSLRMGFRTLAIEKRSSEIRQTLGAVKTEFATYGDVLDKVQKKLTEAQNHIETVGRRGRAIERKLRGIEAVPEPDSVRLLALDAAIQDGEILEAAE